MEYSSNGRHGPAGADRSCALRDWLRKAWSCVSLSGYDGDVCCAGQGAATGSWRQDQCLLCFGSRRLCWTVDWKDVLQIYAYHFSWHVSDIFRHPRIYTADDDDASATTGHFVWCNGLPCLLFLVQL